MHYGYYPGCSLKHISASYHVSTQAIAKALDLQFEEVEDWNCCGATEYFALNKAAAYALVGRNLALAEKQLSRGEGGKGASLQSKIPTLVAPCSACFLNLSKTDNSMGKHSELGQQINTALAAGGLHYTPGSLEVRHLADIVINDVGLEAIKEKVTKPLHGLRVAPYYGCLITRPNIAGHTFDDPEYPTYLDDLMAALGAEVVDFPLKAHCCGGHMTQISSEVAYDLICRLLRNAEEYHADLIVALCPMCQLNLDAYQGQVNKHFKTEFDLPVLYFTQLIGLAFGLPAKELGLGKEIVSAKQALAKIGVELPPPEPSASPAAARKKARSKKRRKKDDKSLPMPRQKKRAATRKTRAKS